MLVVMRYDATDRQIQGVVQAITELGCEARQLHRAQGTTVNVAGNDEHVDSARLASLDGVMVEVHPDPEEALSDGVQSLYPEQFAKMVRRARQVTSAVGRRITSPAPAKLVS